MGGREMTVKKVICPKAKLNNCCGKECWHSFPHKAEKSCKIFECFAREAIDCACVEVGQNMPRKLAKTVKNNPNKKVGEVVEILRNTKEIKVNFTSKQARALKKEVIAAQQTPQGKVELAYRCEYCGFLEHGFVDLKQRVKVLEELVEDLIVVVNSFKPNRGV
jgi:hypothetical protein